jgi:hypothetical protein
MKRGQFGPGAGLGAGNEAGRVPQRQTDLPQERDARWQARRVKGLYAASAFISAYRSALPSKPMPGSSGRVTVPLSTFTPSGKPP